MMSDEALIDLVVMLWIKSGGDAEGFQLLYPKILAKLKGGD